MERKLTREQLMFLQDRFIQKFVNERSPTKDAKDVNAQLWYECVLELQQKMNYSLESTIQNKVNNDKDKYGK